MGRRRRRIQEVPKQGFFTFKNKISFREIGTDTVIPESDLCFQDEQFVYQFEFKKPDEDQPTIIPPGIFTLAETSGGSIIIEEAQLRERSLLTSIVNTQKIIDEASTFFNKLHIYEELGEPKARKILLHSAPGFGKTSTITHFCHHSIKEDPGTVVLIWPTNEVSASQISHFLSEESEYTKECTKLILVMEDIGGGEKESSGGARSVDSAMLDLLDGLKVTFFLPTFIIATTNYPQNLLSALADRPGRFDLIMPLKNLSYEEKIALVEFIGKRPLSEADKLVFKNKDTVDFSVAHLKEIVVRSRLHDRSIADVVKELVEHKKNFKKDFADPKDSLGFGSERN